MVAAVPAVTWSGAVVVSVGVRDGGSSAVATKGPLSAEEVGPVGCVGPGAGAFVEAEPGSARATAAKHDKAASAAAATTRRRWPFPRELRDGRMRLCSQEW